MSDKSKLNVSAARPAALKSYAKPTLKRHGTVAGLTHAFLQSPNKFVGTKDAQRSQTGTP